MSSSSQTSASSYSSLTELMDSAFCMSHSEKIYFVNTMVSHSWVYSERVCGALTNMQKITESQAMTGQGIEGPMGIDTSWYTSSTNDYCTVHRADYDLLELRCDQQLGAGDRGFRGDLSFYRAEIIEWWTVYEGDVRNVDVKATSTSIGWSYTAHKDVLYIYVRWRPVGPESSESSLSSTSSLSSLSIFSSSSSSSSSGEVRPRGTTYLSYMSSMKDIENPVLDNNTRMRHSGNFEIDWTSGEVDFDKYGYGLKRNNYNNGIIFTHDASRVVLFEEGYVGMVISLPHPIIKGVYRPVSHEKQDISDYLLWGMNVNNGDAASPCLFAALTPRGIEFTVWTASSHFTLRDIYTNVPANESVWLEFAWRKDGLDDFNIKNFIGTMVIRVNNQDVVIGNPPIDSNDNSYMNFTVLGYPYGSGSFECTLRKLVTANKIPLRLLDIWQSSSSSSTSSSSESSSTSSSSSFPRYLEYLNICPGFDDYYHSVVSTRYSNIGCLEGSNELQLTVDKREFRYFWLPNSGAFNTLSKIDASVPSGASEVARYAVAATVSDPSRTVVDSNGNCWVANRSSSSVTKVGLTDAGYCRNQCNNTSAGPTDVKPWGQDDAVLLQIDLDKAQAFLPGTNTPAGGQCRGICDDVNGNIWINGGASATGDWLKVVGDGGLNGSGSITKYLSSTTGSSYGAVCAYTNNFIFSRNRSIEARCEWFSADDPTINGYFTMPSVCYGIAYARGYVYLGAWGAGRFYRIDASAVYDAGNWQDYLTTFVIQNVPTGYFRHMAVLVNDDDTEDIFVILKGSVGKNYLVRVINHKQYANGTTVTWDWNDWASHQEEWKWWAAPYPPITAHAGVGITRDAFGDPFVWCIDQGTPNIWALNATTNERVVFDGGTEWIYVGSSDHYNYTNFTGTVEEANIKPTWGQAIFVVDSGKEVKSGDEGILWRSVCLEQIVPSQSDITIKVGASNNLADESSFLPLDEVQNCIDFRYLEKYGRYLKIVIDFSRDNVDIASPTIRGMTVIVSD